MSADRYVCVGSVRGECAHTHRTIAGAVACLDRDRRGCQSLGGGSYSDRSIRHANRSPLTDDECAEYDRCLEVQ